MPKRSKITYYPLLSITENAIKNGAEEKNIHLLGKKVNFEKK